MSRSTSKSVRLPHPIADAITESRARRAGYASLNACMVGLARYDLMVCGEHAVTAAIAHMAPHEQDDIDDFLFELNRRNLKVRGSFLHALIEDVTSRKNPEGQDVSGEVASEIYKLALRWKNGEDVFAELEAKESSG